MFSAGRIGKGHIEYLWNDKLGKAWKITSAVMSFYRYSLLLRSIHFDDFEFETRQQKLQEDRFAIVRELFDIINARFSEHFEPESELCIDEQLLAYRGRVAFKHFIPSKPAKYGFKVGALVDVQTRYTLILEPYVGKQPNLDAAGRPNKFKVSTTPYDLVIRLMKKFVKGGRNLTGDNWFTSVELVRELLRLKTTYVGTIRKNKRAIQPEFQASLQKKILSSLFGFDSQITLVSYVPKKKRSVLLLSSQHHNKIDAKSKKQKKPEIITYYNSTKFGVDCVDQMCESHSTARITRG